MLGQFIRRYRRVARSAPAIGQAYEGSGVTAQGGGVDRMGAGTGFAGQVDRQGRDELGQVRGAKLFAERRILGGEGFQLPKVHRGLHAAVGDRQQGVAEHTMFLGFQ
ncbi:hypothetical protein D3C78_1586400 [compost metagenome]